MYLLKPSQNSPYIRLPGANDSLTLQEFANRTRTTYEGPLVFGEDLMQFHINAKGLITILSVD